MKHHGPVLATLLALAALVPAAAQTPSVEVRDAWARATTSRAIAGGVFLTMTARGGADRLVSVASPVAERVGLHETVAEAGVMKMKEVHDLRLAADAPVVLKPGSFHIMAIGLRRPLRQGESFPVTLSFEKAPAVTVEVKVQAAGAMGRGHGH